MTEISLDLLGVFIQRPSNDLSTGMWLEPILVHIAQSANDVGIKSLPTSGQIDSGTHVSVNIVKASVPCLHLGSEMQRFLFISLYAYNFG